MKNLISTIALVALLATPSWAADVDGKTFTTQPQRFVATKSETGDLIFVEIEGGKDNVFVGQPLDLTLKIWIKPYRDQSTGQTLSEGDMWNMISDSSSWGGFAARMKELAENNQRPGGQEVLRDDGNGHERSYYLYEISATVYPKRAGKIDADDVQIVVEYPTALALVAFVLRRFRTAQSVGPQSGNVQSQATQAVASLRIAGWYPLASEFESFLADCPELNEQALAVTKAKASELMKKIDAAIAGNKKTRVKSPNQRVRKMALHRPLGLLVAATLIASASSGVAVAEDATTAAPNNPLIHATSLASDSVTLSPAQQKTLLAEATDVYSQGLAASQSDAADAKNLMEVAASKYQLLADSGIQNADLFVNLANANLQIGKLGLAIANYEKALVLNPGHEQALHNLAFANEKVEGGQVQMEPAGSVRSFNNAAVDFLGEAAVLWTLALSSVIFWGLLILRLVYRRFPVWKWVAVPLVLLLISLSSVALTESNPRSAWNAVIVADNVSLHAGDGEQFDEVVAIDSAQGHRVEVLAQRGNWTEIRTAEGHHGWVPDHDLEIVKAI